MAVSWLRVSPTPSQGGQVGISSPCKAASAPSGALQSTWPAVPAAEGSAATICSSFHCMNFANSLLRHVYEFGRGRLQAGLPVMMEGLPGSPQVAFRSLGLAEDAACSLLCLPPVPSAPHPASRGRLEHSLLSVCSEHSTSVCPLGKRRSSHLAGEGQRDPGPRLKGQGCRAKRLRSRLRPLLPRRTGATLAFPGAPCRVLTGPTGDCRCQGPACFVLDVVCGFCLFPRCPLRMSLSYNGTDSSPGWQQSRLAVVLFPRQPCQCCRGSQEHPGWEGTPGFRPTASCPFALL